MPPEQKARQEIDRQLQQAGWFVQSQAEMNIFAGRGVAFRQFKLTSGFVYYLLYRDGKAAGVIEAKKKGFPLTEQKRIVSKIEELFSDLDAGVAALKRARANLRRYRASVLKSAVEGRLTAAWRSANPGVEPASELLARILRERRQRWEQKQLATYESKGKKPPKSWQSKYKEPAAPDTANVPELPNGWCWATVGQFAECLDHKRVPVNKKERAERVGDIPYYGANGPVGFIDDYLFDEPLVLVVEDETFVGRSKPFCYKITGKSWVNNHAHILRATDATTIDFINYALHYYDFVPMTTGTTGRRKLTKLRLMAAPVALPPLEEQCEIVREVNDCLSGIGYCESTIDRSLARSNVLRQCALKSAFEGKLEGSA